MLSVSEEGCIEGSVIVPNIVLNGIVKGDIEAGDRVELGPKARVLGSVHYTTIETAVGAQILGKLIHRRRPKTRWAGPQGCGEPKSQIWVITLIGRRLPSRLAL